MINDNDTGNDENAGEDSVLLEVAGRKFPDTVEGREQLKTFVSGLSKVAGSNAQKNGDLLSENRSLKEKLEEIQGSDTSSDWDEILNDEEADPSIKRMAAVQKKKDLSFIANKKQADHRQWYADLSSKVIAQAPELAKLVDDDVVEAVLRKHGKAIETAANPLDAALSLIGKKFKLETSSNAADDEESDHPSLGARPLSGSGSTTRPSPKNEEKGLKRDKTLTGLGYK